MIKSQYLEAVRLYLWYRGSRFSVHQGKASRELAERYRRLAGELFERMS